MAVKLCSRVSFTAQMLAAKVRFDVCVDIYSERGSVLCCHRYAAIVA